MKFQVLGNTKVSRTRENGENELIHAEMSGLGFVQYFGRERWSARK